MSGAGPPPRFLAIFVNEASHLRSTGSCTQVRALKACEQMAALQEAAAVVDESRTASFPDPKWSPQVLLLEVGRVEDVDLAPVIAAEVERRERAELQRLLGKWGLPVGDPGR